MPADRSFEEANRLWEEGMPAEALAMFSRLAEQGDAASMNSVGYFFDKGIAVRRDRRRALESYRRAAVAGLVAANVNVGLVYLEMGNIRRARHWLRRGFLLGDGDAAVDLAKTYIAGARVHAASRALAVKYLNAALASSQICTEGRETAAELLSEMSVAR
jgi:TPR repeat protein